MISEKKRLQIAIICYANVSGEFAMFTNPKYRGPNFTWNWFVDHCEKDAWQWMFLNSVDSINKKEVHALASQFAKEIAQRLVDRAEVNKHIETEIL